MSEYFDVAAFVGALNLEMTQWMVKPQVDNLMYPADTHVTYRVFHNLLPIHKYLSLM
jgi:hypothetical protein